MNSGDSALVQNYYGSVFPVETLYKFLYESPNREFSMTLQGNKYVRALSFDSPQKMRSMLISKIPEKLDIGAVYSSAPAMGKEFHPIQKELVFDVDLTDYKRNCCNGKKICDLCFTLVKCSAKLMDYILTKIFGFKYILYVFSGGRGIHIWVCDEEARFLDDKERKGIINYVDFYNISNNESSTTSFHKTIDDEILNILKEYQYFFGDQNMNIEVDTKALIEYLYVKIDKNVTSEMKHLLKSPFSIHPISRRISVPLNIDNIDSIKIADLPFLDDIMTDESKIVPYLNYFNDFCDNLLEKKQHKMQ
ncbi:hypothetical protein EDEG_02860 [Edhazardia aedis USNM 41457]|uniref:DNA primase n=1 Tax=Edhazardia aedis (strain USNM 41457) TaxID=1003232 RepID=J9D5C9_EDHAE|nr:hypothetical protein EDEG_02860 [Edhazardia aedis USNM 41457]|eukprot:EJW02739.1 hypothetical protein EDEG_02860 [Edhazardia aedis USNM 41457]